MLGFIKNLLGKRPAEETAPPATHHPASTPGSSVPAQAPASHAAAPPRPAAAAIPKAKGNAERVLLSLKAITDRFPGELQGIIAHAPNESVIIALPIEPIVAQLPSGNVAVKLADLRRVAPFNIFAIDNSKDEELVQIPLEELVARLDPSFFQRTSQRKVEVPEEIGGVFIKRGEGDPTKVKPIDPGALAKPAAPAPAAAAPPPIPAAPAPKPAAPVERAPGLAAPAELSALFGNASPVAEPAPAPAPVPVEAVEEEAPVLQLKTEAPVASPAISLAPSPAEPAPSPIAEVAPAPAPPQETQIPKGINLFAPPKPEAFRRTAPIELPKEPAPAVDTSAPVIPLKRQPIVDAPAPRLTPAAPIAPPAPIVEAAAPATPEPIRLASPVKPPEIVSPAPAPASDGKVIALPLAALSDAWPEAIREEIAGASPESIVEYPAADLAAALKQGRVNQPWQCLRAMIQPPLAGTSDPLYAEALLELPLKVVAPIFMSGAAAARPTQKKLAIDESIPSPFAAAAPAPVEPALAATPGGALGLDGRLPSELIDRACALNGVGGAIIALKEGLLVAAKVPGEFNGETLASFLPQLFGRLGETLGRMEIGELQHLMFTAGDRPWQLWKTGDIYFVAMGKPNELLPGAQLKVIAAQLARHTRK